METATTYSPAHKSSSTFTPARASPAARSARNSPEHNNSMPTTDEEWAKVADAVERRRVQNRNAQRKYRKKCKRRAEELERRKASGTFTSTSTSQLSTPNPSRLSTPQTTINTHVHNLTPIISQEQFDPNMSMPLQTSPQTSLEYKPNFTHVTPEFKTEYSHGSDGSYDHFQPHRTRDCSSMPPESTIYPWLPADGMISQPQMHSPPYSIGEPIDISQQILDSVPFPDMFPISSVPTSLYSQNDMYASSVSEGMISPKSQSRSSASSISERGTSVKPESPSASSGLSMLHIAAMKGDHSMVNLLLEKGGDPNIIDSHGHTPLHLAVESGHTDIAHMLLENGASIYARTD